ncbi:hypothetical protein [Saccharomonospora saliphila]|uniref:hypothetical protein n=1 Tax=Saccharomonospora saliphila TaxID=369829 RepID=UPI00039D135F|nr:hypothetical protein [Saccharomonospora saliphila]
MRRPLRHLTGAVLAGTLIAGFAAGPASATSEEAPSPTASSPVESSPSAPTESEPTDSSTPGTTEPGAPTDTDPTETTEPTGSEPSEPEPTDTTEPSEPGETEPTEPTETEPTDPTEPTEPTETTEPTDTEPPAEEPEYIDDVAAGIDLDPEQGLGLLVIACAAGEPRGVSSDDFDILEGAYQDETDGRYWWYMVRLHDGLTFAENSAEIGIHWQCGDRRPGGGGSVISPVPGSDGADDWQDDNGGDAQVAYAPRGGVETGAGGMARR